MNDPNEAPLDIARGDRGLSQHLKASMRLLAERSEDHEFKALIKDALEGRRSLRDLAGSPAFERTLTPLVSSFAEKYRSLSEDERESMADEGQRQLDDLGASSPTDLEEDDGDDGFYGGSVLRSDW